MKKIEVTDEMHDFLMELSEQLNTQDHRGTRMPYFFQIQETKLDICVEGNGEQYWIDEEGETLSDEDIKQNIFDYYLEHDSNKSDEELQGLYDNLEDYEIEEFCEGEFNLRSIWMEYKQTLSGSFLTEKACNTHIKQNDYHYHNPKSYLSGGFRNPEMEKVMKFLCELTGGKLHT